MYSSIEIVRGSHRRCLLLLAHLRLSRLDRRLPGLDGRF